MRQCTSRIRGTEKVRTQCALVRSVWIRYNWFDKLNFMNSKRIYRDSEIHKNLIHLEKWSIPVVFYIKYLMNNNALNNLKTQEWIFFNGWPNIHDLFLASVWDQVKTHVHDNFRAFNFDLRRWKILTGFSRWNYSMRLRREGC